MFSVIINREMRDPLTGKTRFLSFHVKVRDHAHLMKVMAEIDAQYPRRERYDA